MQQCLPLAVLKLVEKGFFHIRTLVATVPTACGIETGSDAVLLVLTTRLQQCLPLAVLKLTKAEARKEMIRVATVPTACGIETSLE